jgi:hypothetical protein
MTFSTCGQFNKYMYSKKEKKKYSTVRITIMRLRHTIYVNTVQCRVLSRIGTLIKKSSCQLFI